MTATTTTVTAARQTALESSAGVDQLQLGLGWNLLRERVLERRRACRYRPRSLHPVHERLGATASAEQFPAKLQR